MSLNNDLMMPVMLNAIPAYYTNYLNYTWVVTDYCFTAQKPPYNRD